MSTPAAKLAEKVGFQDVREYLKHHGWVSATSRRSYAAVYRFPSTGETKAEVVVPLERELADYGEAIERVAQRTAEVEGRSPEAVLHDWLQPRMDTVRFALEGEGARSGSVDLLAGVALLSGAKKCLLASAMTAKRPVRFHRRMALAEADAYIGACRMGQTEFGSFVVTLQTPVQISPQLDALEPAFGRRATEYLFRATDTLVTAIRQDTVQQTILDEQQQDGTIVVSANLCDGLVEMMPSNESVDLRLRATWSPILPRSADLQTEVQIDRNLFETVELIAQRLRPSEDPRPGRYYGYVVQLAGGLAAEGSVTLQVLAEIEDGELVDVRAVLDRDEYRKAAEAHLQRRVVQVDGVLHRGRRLHELRNITGFKVLAED